MNWTRALREDWKRTGGLAAVFGGAASVGLVLSLGVSVWASLIAASLVASVFFALFATLILTNAKLARLHARVEQAEQELRAIVNVRPITGPVPLQLGGWAMDAVFAEVIAREIALRLPRLVLECGSGSSTVLTASCLGHWVPDGRVVSLDHEEEYAAKTRQLLQVCGQGGRGTVIFAPLRSQSVEGVSRMWYEFDPATLNGTRIDLLIVDGPPAGTCPLARYPAVPLLRNHLADEFVIIMDDGKRPDEIEIARRWAEELAADLLHLPEGKGTWIIRSRVPAAHSELDSSMHDPTSLRANLKDH